VEEAVPEAERVRCGDCVAELDAVAVLVDDSDLLPVAEKDPVADELRE